MGIYEVPLFMSLLGFWMGTMLANIHMCGIMLLLRAVLHILEGNASPRGPCVLGDSCLVCQDPVSCYFCILDLSCGECNGLCLYFSVKGSVACLTGFVHCW